MLSDVRRPIGDWLYTPPHHAGGGRTWEVHSLSVPSDDVFVLGNTGVHAPTSRQVAMVAKALAADPHRMMEIEAIGTVARRGIDALARGDYEAVGHAMSENHLLLRNLGVSSSELEALIQAALLLLHLA